MLNEQGWEGVRLKARLADAAGEEYLMELPLPENAGRPYVPQAGHRWRVFYLLNGSALFSFDTRVLGVVQSNISLVRVTLPEDNGVEKIQRRDFLRMPIKLDVTLEAENSAYQLHGVTLNISGGGMAVSCHPKTPVKGGDRLSGLLHVPADDGRQRDREVPVSVEVVRVDPALGQTSRTICYCKFTSLRPKDQAAIIRLCNKRQRELHIKGLEQ